MIEPQGNLAMERLVQLPKKHYRNCTDIPDSVNNIRPERGQGHLIGNNPIKALGRFFSNRYYDLKSVYKGYTGTANDHQLGRTNDVGLVAGGLGIATFLAARRSASLPKHMEFIGLGSFLASMSLWPKIGVFGPARLVHGFDVDKRYIDDQGRNKSVFQDPNYVPFDLFDGRRKSENLNDIANYMGISKDAINRDDMTKDQMVKIARQNNTLWMLSSGVAVPIMTALISNGVERVYTPFLFAQKSKKHEAELNKLYEEISSGAQVTESKNVMGKSVSKIITGLADKDIVTQEQIDKVIASATEGINTEFASGFAREINGRLSNVTSKQVVADEKFVSDLAKNLEETFQGHKHLKKAILSVDGIKATLIDKVFADGIVLKKSEIISKIKSAGISEVPSSVEKFLEQKFDQKVTKGKPVTIKSDFVAELISKLEPEVKGDGVAEKLSKLKLSLADKAFSEGIVVEKAELLNKIKSVGIEKLDAAHRGVLGPRFDAIITSGQTILPESKKMVMTDEVKNILKALAEPIEKYSKQYSKIQKVNEMQMGADSVNAYYWGKLEKAFTDIAIPTKSIGKLKGLMDNTPDITDVMVANFEKIVKDKKAYNKAVSTINEIKLAYLQEILGPDKVSEYVDVVLGRANSGKLGLWSLRGNGSNSNKVDKFIEMHRKISEDLLASMKKAGLGTGANTFTSIVSELIPTQEAVAQVSGLENFVSACDRILHSLDVYKRADIYKNSGKEAEMAAQLGQSGDLVTPGWINELFEKAKRETIGATSNDVFLRFGFKDRPQKYQSFMNLVYPANGDYVYLNEATMQAMTPVEISKIDSRLAEIEKQISNGVANTEKLLEEKGKLLTKKKSLQVAHDSTIATLKSWVSRYRNIIPDIWHRFAEHGIAGDVDLNWLFAGFDVADRSKYAYDKLQTPAAKYRIQAKNLVELADQGIKQAHNSGKWLRTFGGLFVGVFAASIMTQFFFGKKDSTIPLEKDRIRQMKMASRAERMEATRAN